MHITAGIHVYAVAIGVDHDVVDRQIVDAGSEDSEVTAPRDTEIAKRYVAAELERDGLVGGRSPLTHQRRAGNAATADDGDILQVLAPDHAVVKMAVAEVLELVPLVR